MPGTNSNKDGTDKSVKLTTSTGTIVVFHNPSVSETQPNAGKPVAVVSAAQSVQGTTNGVIFSNPA